jgi:hypothetical protein
LLLSDICLIWPLPDQSKLSRLSAGLSRFKASFPFEVCMFDFFFPTATATASVTRLVRTGLVRACLGAGLLGGVAMLPAHATITCCGAIDTSVASGKSVELVFVAWDKNAASGPKVSFVKDLGVTMGDFFIAGQQDTGSHSSYWLGGNDDAVWTSFLGSQPSAGVTVDPSKVQWAVMAFDTAGDITPGSQNLYTTLQQGVSGNPSVILGLSDYTGGKLQDSTASVFTWLSVVNQTAGHANNANGSAVIKISDGLAFAFGDGQPGSTSGDFTFNANLGRSIGNTMGKSSWFYAVTSNDPDFGDVPVAIDEFDNLSHDAYWGLAAAGDGTGRYLLSYTLEGMATAAEVSRNVLFGNNFARLAGTLSLSSPAGKAASVLSLTESFLRGVSGSRAAASATSQIAAVTGLGGALNLVSSVPEPGTWALLLGGGLLVAGAARRASGRAAEPTSRRQPG